MVKQPIRLGCRFEGLGPDGVRSVECGIISPHPDRCRLGRNSFFGYALTTKSHVMTVFPVIIGACAVATAFYLILDLSRPYSGVFHISSPPLEQVLAVMGKE
jgi:hypothetical protein